MTEFYKEKESYKWLVLAISFLLMLTFALTLQVLPPIFDHIIKDIPFSNAQAGSLMGVYAIPGIIISLPIAFMVKKNSPKKMIVLGLVIMIIGLVAFSLSGTYLSLLIWRLVIGTGATILLVLGPFLVTMFFENKSLGTAMGIFNIAVPVGVVFAANAFGLLGEIIEWRTIILGLSVFVLLVLIVVSLGLSIPKKKSIRISDSSEAKEKEKFKISLGLGLLGLIWAITNFQLLAYITFGSQYFQSVGISLQKAGLFVSFIMIMQIFLCPLIGIVFDKTNREKEILITGSIIVAVSFILIGQSVTLIPLWAIALGIGTSPIPVFLFSYLPKIVEPENVGVGLAIITIALNIGTTIGPASFGLILDITAGSFFIGFAILGLMSVVVIAALVVLKTKESKELAA